MRVDEYFDLDLHMLLFLIATGALLAIYITLKILMFIVRQCCRLCKRGGKTVKQEDKKKVD